MKVEIVVTCVLVSEWRVMRAGETHDVSPDDARSLIASGLARMAQTETATVAPPENAVSVLSLIHI